MRLKLRLRLKLKEGKSNGKPENRMFRIEEGAA